MTVREGIAYLNQCDPDAHMVMPSADGSGVYVDIEAIEPNYHVTRSGALWFPEGDFDPATGKHHVFNKRQRPPLGSVKAVALWETSLAQRAPVGPQNGPESPSFRLAWPKLPRLRISRAKIRNFPMFRLIVAALAVYLAWPYKALIVSSPLLAACAAVVLCAIFWAKIK